MFILGLPSTASLLRAFYPMKITPAGNSLDLLPCDIVELQVVNQYETPNLPLDNNSFVSDNIYRMPRIVTARVYVHNSDYDSFLNKIDDCQYFNGFDIYGVDSQKFKNLRLTDISQIQSAEVVGAYFFNLTFKETILVGAFAGAIAKKVKNGAFGGNTNKGEATASPAKKSSILKDFTR